MHDIIIPKGFKFLGEHVGIKRKRRDLGVIYSENICNGSAVFTKNAFCGVSIPIGKKVIQNNEIQAVVVTSGIANVATEEEGTKNALQIMESLSKELCINKYNILPSSTGIIGPQLPIDKIINYMPGVKNILKEEKLEDFAKAILTTDKNTKIRSIQVEDKTILGIAKGSGMMEPNMATMLVYILTDALIPKDKIYNILKNAVDQSFNMISIDTDTSTSDTVGILANGSMGEVDLNDFSTAVTKISKDLAKDIVRDGEGATKLIQVKVTKSNSFEDAKKIAKSIVNSPLVKTAMYGNDPNWGRIIMAIGKTEDVLVYPKYVSIKYGNHSIYNEGNVVEENIQKIESYLRENDTIDIQVTMGTGKYEATVWGCDLTKEYVDINSLYST
ncbi:bifunctional glutamate N-acetyltransferase/amino-acid acetyltransferase ArgJ [Staphylococcus equorum]